MRLSLPQRARTSTRRKALPLGRAWRTHFSVGNGGAGRLDEINPLLKIHYLGIPTVCDTTTPRIVSADMLHYAIKTIVEDLSASGLLFIVLNDLRDLGATVTRMCHAAYGVDTSVVRCASE